MKINKVVMLHNQITLKWIFSINIIQKKKIFNMMNNKKILKMNKNKYKLNNRMIKIFKRIKKIRVQKIHNKLINKILNIIINKIQ